jgi:hypothetical protein
MSDMTTIAELTLSHLEDGYPLGRFIYPQTGEAKDATPRMEAERVVALVQNYGAAAFIYEDDASCGLPAKAAAAIIPAGLAQELIAEGRLPWPLYTSRTVLA